MFYSLYLVTCHKISHMIATTYYLVEDMGGPLLSGSNGKQIVVMGYLHCPHLRYRKRELGHLSSRHQMGWRNLREYESLCLEEDCRWVRGWDEANSHFQFPLDPSPPQD